MSDLALSPANPTEAKAPVAPRLFTAAQIAAALGRSKRGILLALDSCPQSGTVLVGTNEAKAWTVAALPEPMKAQLARAARRGHHRAIEDCIDAAGKPWDPGVPAASIPAEAWDKARKLREAMVPMLERMDSFLGSKAEFEASGVERYQRAFGHAITTRYWRELLSRTLRRDAGQENWGRLELYLDDQALKKTKPSAPKAGGIKAEFDCLRQTISTWKDSENPDQEERAALWHLAFMTFEENAEGKQGKRFKRALLEFLFNDAPSLSTTRAALRKNFDRKLSEWRNSGGLATALLDKRGPNPIPDIPEKDKLVIIAESALNHSGRLRPALRELRATGKDLLTPQTFELLQSNSASKSYCNSRIARAVAPDINMLVPHTRGRKAVMRVTPWIRRDYADIVSMDIVNADDLTPPVYFWDETKNPRESLFRGQLLVWIDVRSLKVIHFSFLRSPNYNSFAIASSQNIICRELAIPKKWQFERGIWRRSIAIVRPQIGDWQDACEPSKAVTSWAKIGTLMWHSTTPQAKPVEFVLNLLQNRMECLPGYSGRDERVDMPKATAAAMRDVQSGRKLPHEVGFLSFEKLEQVYGEVVLDYNSTPQDGDILKGLSPNEAFEKYWPHDSPPQKLDENCWHICAPLKRRIIVPDNGKITFKLRGEHFDYFSEQTGRLRGQEVITWFNPEIPEMLGITDIKGNNPVGVARVLPVGYLASFAEEGSREREAFIEARKRQAETNRYPKTLFRTIKNETPLPTRYNIIDRQTSEQARVFRDAHIKMKERGRAESDVKCKIDRLAGELGIPRNSVGNDAAALESLQSLKAIDRRNQTVLADESQESFGGSNE